MKKEKKKKFYILDKIHILVMSPGFKLSPVRQKTRFQEVASSGSSHFHFCIFDEIVTMNEKVSLNIQSYYLNFFLD